MKEKLLFLLSVPCLLRRQFRLTLLLTFLILFVLIVNLLSTKPYIFISATSDILSYRVVRKEVAIIPLTDALVRSDEPSVIKGERHLFTGLLKPSTDAIVYYRFTPEKISIVVEGGASSSGILQYSNGTEQKLSQRAMFIVSVAQTPLKYLPIAGPAEIGQEFGVRDTFQGSDKIPTPIMSEGSVLVFGRGRIWPYSKDLYPIIGGSFALPAGGRLSSGDPLVPGAPSEAEPWFGIATITPKGFSISATTLSSSLRIYRMGSSGESEKFALSILTQIFSDPAFQWGILFIGLLDVLFNFFKLIKNTLQNQAQNEK